MISQTEIKSLATKYFDEVVGYRRYLHAHPELSFHEEQTARYLEQLLISWGLQPRRVAETGLTGLIYGAGEGPCITLRADIDALPILEENEVPYKSCNPGVMHACGHDVHSASLLGAIKILLELKDKWSGVVRYLFQPAEEVLPGGALGVIQSGVLENPRPDAIIAQHVFPELPAGMVGFRSGHYMASSDEVFFEVIGKGGHAAFPHLLKDPVVMASTLIVSLQQLVSRSAPPDIPTVLSFGKMIANGATNVIPDRVSIAGTFRTLNEEWRARAHELIIQTATKLIDSLGGELEYKIVNGYPSLFNEPLLTREMQQIMTDFMGQEQVKELPIRMGAEDFARYGQILPAFFYRLGTGQNSLKRNIHTATFDVDESSLLTGMGLMAWLAVSWLRQSASRWFNPQLLS